MGRILFGGTAALLICIFLSPKFIEFLREREFGQHIREDGPAGHHQKAGTPTMGGIIIFLAVAVAFLILTNYEWRSVGVFGAAIACALLGFADDYTKLVKRRSLGLGGAIAGLAIMTKTEVLLILLGGIFVIEALSVVIQVVSFQLTRRRVFLMAPIHHHFELKAWSETKIILRFWIVASICGAIGFTVYRQSRGL